MFDSVQTATNRVCRRSVQPQLAFYVVHMCDNGTIGNLSLYTMCVLIDKHWGPFFSNAVHYTIFSKNPFDK